MSQKITPPLFYSKLLLSLVFFMAPLSLYILLNNKILLLDWTMISMNSSSISFMLILDPKGITFATIVFFISSSVMKFANAYMMTEFYLLRFTHLVMFFVLSMALLIFIPNMITLLLGWDGLGLVSFLLVIYYQNPKSLAAGMITALSNRIGDVLLLLAIGWTMTQGHWSLMNMWPLYIPHYIIILIMLAAMTKSAQIPFSSWLPAAMAAPTPVSALVHSSTLVTAGVFLLIRFYPFLATSFLFFKMLLIFATTTMLMASLVALVEFDLKKIIALSTLSQLGIMMTAIGLQLPMLAYFHLLTHALFKALLFLCAGTMIHYHSHSQDLRQMGSTLTQMPLTAAAMLTANLALCGAPFLTGFYSKDLILEILLAQPYNFPIIILMFFSTMLTAAYSIRLTILNLWFPQQSLPLHNNSNENKDFSISSMMLMVGAILGGASMNWIIMVPCIHPFISSMEKFSALMISILGIFISLFLIKPHSPNILKFPLNKTSFLLITTTSMWFLTPISTQSLLYFPFITSHKLLTTVDHGWMEVMSAKGAFMLTSKLSSMSQHFQSNLLTTHIFISFLILLPFSFLLI